MMLSLTYIADGQRAPFVTSVCTGSLALYLSGYYVAIVQRLYWRCMNLLHLTGGLGAALLSFFRTLNGFSVATNLKALR